MKRIIALLLVLVMTMALFAGCDNNNVAPTDPTEGTTATEPTSGSNVTVNQLENARAYLKNMYKDSNGTMTRVDYTVVSVVSIGDTSYDIEWTIETIAGDPEAVAVSDDGTIATIQILNPKPTEEVQYNLVGTITDGTDTVTVSFAHTIGAVEPEDTMTVVTPQTSIQAGVAYKWGMYQANVDKTLYFVGTTTDKDYYLATTEDVNAATDVYVEEVEGGYHLYFTDAEGTKMYIDMYKNGDYFNLRLTTEPTATLVWNTEYNTLVATIEEGEYYIGTYKTYETLSCSSLSYAATSFPSTMYTLEEVSSSTTVTLVTEPTAEVGFKWGMYQANIDKTLYFAGTIADKDYYLATTEDINAATDVYLETIDGGYHLYFIDADGNKMYIDMYKNGDYFNIRLTTEPTATLVWNSEYNTLVATIEGGDYYIGTYKTYETLSCSSTSYIATSFAANLYKVEQKAASSVEKVTEPAAEAGYKWGMYQANIDKTLYFAGTTTDKDYYLATTEDISAATDVYLEAVEGGYHLYFIDADGNKMYIDMYKNGDYFNIRLTTEPTATLVWNAEYNTLVATIEGGDYYIGTYKTYETLSCSSTSYIATSFPANLFEVK